jgi:P-type Cu2+ transporter
MNTVAASTTAELAPVQVDTGRCFHCALPLPDRPMHHEMLGATREFCCEGCAAAARWIHAARLDNYYALRSSAGSKIEVTDRDLTTWDRPDIMREHLRNVPEGCEIVLLVEGMRCAACAWLIDRALTREAGLVEISANAVTGRIRLIWNPASNKLSAILGRLLTLGYRPFLTGNRESELAIRAEQRNWMLRLGVAGIGALQAMMYAEALYLDTAHQMPLATRDFFRWLTFLVATPVVFYAGLPFIRGAWRELQQRQPGMDTLVSASVLIAWGASTLEMLRGGAQVWFDAAVMFVFLLLIGRFIEQRTRRIATARLDTLARARPTLIDREQFDGKFETVAAADLVRGDIVRVAAGDRVPADATLLDAAASFNESLLTGEAKPVIHQPGDLVMAGSTSANSGVRLKVVTTGAATQLSALTALVQRAQEFRPRVTRIADRAATWFVGGLALTAAAVYFYWHATEPARAFEIALAVLVISCPCALSLAVPAALAAAYSRLSTLGLLPIRAEALETLADVSDVVFDKTGTLGDGQWQLLATQVFGDTRETEALQIAAALEAGVNHPLASAFQTHAGNIRATGIKLHAGGGIEGHINGRTLLLGTAPFAAASPDDGAIWLGDGHVAMARFQLLETARPDAAAALTRLRAMGKSLHVLSGDSTSAVQAFIGSQHLRVDSSAGRLLPQDKLARVRELQSQGRIVAMVGDGLNDAPVLAGANVSLAMASGAALTQRAADLVILNPSLQRIRDALQLASRTRRIIRQNLAWAVAYNVVAIPLAASGHVAPWAAAAAMVVSSLTVTLNALRLSRKP